MSATGRSEGDDDSAADGRRAKTRGEKSFGQCLSDPNKRDEDPFDKDPYDDEDPYDKDPYDKDPYDDDDPYDKDPYDDDDPYDTKSTSDKDSAASTRHSDTPGKRKLVGGGGGGGGEAKNVKRSRKAEKRKASDALLDDETKKVYIWDLDETLIIFQSLLSGTFASGRGLDVSACESLALRMEELIVRTAETNFFFNELEQDGDRVHIDDAIGEDDDDDDDDGRSPNVRLAADDEAGRKRKLLLQNRYRQIKTFYERVARCPETILGNGGKELREQIESVTECWVSSAATKCLSAVSNRSQKSVNVIVTNSQLVAAFVKLLLNRLATFFPVANVYSSAKVGKEYCISSIRRRFPSASLVVIGDGKEEEEAAEKLDLLFWKVANKRDLNSLATAIDLNYM